MSQDTITLFAEPTERSIELRREIEKFGRIVNLVFCADSPGLPYVQSRLTTIRGYENIRRFFASREPA